MEGTAEGEVAQLAYLAAHGNDIPKNFKQATTSSESEKWWKAMQEEIDLLTRRGTWVVENLPKGRKKIGCQWTYNLKYGPKGEILRHKARLVAQGFYQMPGLDYSDTFSPTA